MIRSSKYELEIAGEGGELGSVEEILGTAEGEVHCQRPPPHDVIEVIDFGQIEVPDK